MNPIGGAEQFRQLSAENQARYIAISRQLARFAGDHAVPIIFAPPLSIGGKINGASGCVVRLGADTSLVTASHVLGGYEERVEGGERINWQVGNLPRFDPIPRIVWRNRERDIVVLRITENEARTIGPCMISAPSKWPPPAPQEGQLVLVGGYPKALREEEPSSGWIGAGSYSAVFRVTAVGEGYCKCVIERKDLISFDGKPLPDPGTDMGGISGGPVLLVDTLSYALLGVVTYVPGMCGKRLILHSGRSSSHQHRSAKRDWIFIPTVTSSTTGIYRPIAWIWSNAKAACIGIRVMP